MPGTVFFAHGKESGPWGAKIQALARVAEERGFRVESPDYSDLTDPDERVDRLLSLCGPSAAPLVLVGSSMGGYVSTVASAALRPAGLFLMAPAFFLPGYADQDPVPGTDRVTLVHGWNDEVVPVGNALRFARQHRSELHLLNDDHRLVGQLETLQKFFGYFLERI